MQLLDSIIDGALLMPSRKEGDALIAAYVRYMKTGDEPNDLKGNALAQWVSNFPAIENARMRIENGSRGGRAKASKASSKSVSKRDSESSSKQASKASSKSVSKRDSEQVSSSSSYTSSSSSQVELGCNSTGVGVQGEGFDPPTLDEARTYFAANCLKGDPELFWATYDAKGWIDGGGRPITSWTSQALKWSRMQVARDAERNGGELPPPPPKPVNAPDEGDLEADERAFFERYGYWPGEGDGS